MPPDRFHRFYKKIRRGCWLDDTRVTSPGALNPLDEISILRHIHHVIVEQVEQTTFAERERKEWVARLSQVNASSFGGLEDRGLLKLG